MQHLRLRIRVLERRPHDEDEVEGRFLADLVRAARARGTAAPVAGVVREARTELIGLHDVAGRGLSVPSFLAGLCASEPPGHTRPRAVGLAGRFLVRQRVDASGGPPDAGAPVGLAFLEWPDCRWWHWRTLLDGEGKPVPDSDTLRRAIDGDPLPGGLGRWWSHARRTGATVRYGKLEPDPPAPPPLVH
jgi:hypothetical protein